MNKKSKFWPWAIAWLILAILSCWGHFYTLPSHIQGSEALMMGAIPAAFLWVCRLLNYSVVASFTGALFLIMAPVNLKHGSIEWPGRGHYNVLFSLLLLGALFLALRPASKKAGYLWAVFFGLTLSVYALFWQGWGLLFFMGAACALGAAAYNFFIKKDPLHTRQNLLSLVLFTGITLLVVSVYFSFRDFFVLLKEGFGELGKTSLESITALAGGPIFLLLAFGGWAYSLRMAIENPRQTRAIDTLILTIFLIVTMTLSFNGGGFVLFATVPLSVLAAAAVGRFTSLRSVGLPLAGLLIVFVLFNALKSLK